jgi:sugar phosphate isomerase/epimerase
MTILSLAHLTVLDQPPPQMIRLAARLGYDRVGLRLIQVTDTSAGYPLHEDPALLRQTRAALSDTGITVNDIEFVRLTPDLRPADLRPFLEAGAALGAAHVICAPYDPDLSRMADTLAVLHSHARDHGLSCMLEFFPWTVVPDLAAARDLVGMTGQPDIGILLDTLHFDRSASRLEDLQGIPPDRLPFVHLCDALVHPPYSTDEFLHTGRAERLPPGAGQIDLAAILRLLPPTTPLSLEVPMVALQAKEGSEEVAARAIEGARQVLAGLPRRPDERQNF